MFTSRATLHFFPNSVSKSSKKCLPHTADLYVFNRSDYVASGVISCTYKL